MQLISYLDALRPGKKKSRKVEVPVAVVFTKADLFEEWIGDPEAFARGNVSGFTRSARRGWNSVPSSARAWRARPPSSWTSRGRRAWSRCASSLAGSSSRSRGWSASCELTPSRWRTLEAMML